MDWQVPLGPKHNPRLIVHATLCCYLFVCVRVLRFIKGNLEAHHGDRGDL